MKIIEKYYVFQWMWPSALSAKLQNSNKNPSKINKNCDFIFDPIFDRFLINFGLPNRSKIDPKTMQKNTLFWIAFLITLGSIFGGFWGPKRGNSSLLFRSFWTLFGSWSRLGAKMPPRPPQRPPRSLQEASWDGFSSILINF